jgi:RNA polymerase sigma-70 factor (ECF subfamily)
LQVLAGVETNLDTKQLVLSLQGGSPDALGSLFDRFNRLVYRTALGILGDTENASDLLQEVFLRLYRFAKHIDPDRPLEPWLYRMTVNLSYTWVKRRRWLQPLEDIADWFAGDKRLQPSVVAEERETLDLVARAVSKLPLPQRSVIVLFYINECSLLEVSEILEIPPGTVKSRLHYARLNLKEYLDVHDNAQKELNLEYT